jgi:type VI secretion system protein ImpL
LWEYALKESACYLQELWAKEVLFEVRGLADQRHTAQVVKFIKERADPFLIPSPKKGYYAKAVLNQEMGFERGFLSFLTKTKGSDPSVNPAETYAVHIKGLPTSTNPEARVRPHALHLEVRCSDTDLQKMDNYMFPVRKTFKWSPGKCGDVILSIEIGDVVAKKKYSGLLSFAHFLQDFKTGERVFDAEEFPEEVHSLRHLNVRYIKVPFQFTNHEPVLNLLGESPGAAPEIIAQCWGH